jgi:hypothetical protein
MTAGDVDPRLLDPTFAPTGGQPSKKSPLAGSGVRRANRNALYVAVAFLLCFIGTVAVIAAKKAEKVQAQQLDQAPSKVVSSQNAAKAIADRIPNGLAVPDDPPPAPAPPPPAKPVEVEVPAKTAPAAPLVPTVRVDVPPLPAGRPLVPANDDADKFEKGRGQKLEEALRASSAISLQAQRRGASQSAGSAPASNNPPARDPAMAAYQARISQLRGAGALGGGLPSNGLNGEGLR